jgi:uncharacterized protein YbjQ (UPF0145 family)
MTEQLAPSAGHIRHEMTATTFELTGYRVVENLGVVMGIAVRSRSIVGFALGSVQTVFGGNITAFTQLCTRTRSEAFELMLEHAEQHGANAVVGVRYDANEMLRGVTEVLCYGTAVLVEPV